jgi:hypothetical protein
MMRAEPGRLEPPGFPDQTEDGSFDMTDDLLSKICEQCGGTIPFGASHARFNMELESSTFLFDSLLKCVASPNYAAPTSAREV